MLLSTIKSFTYLTVYKVGSCLITFTKVGFNITLTYSFLDSGDFSQHLYLAPKQTPDLKPGRIVNPWSWIIFFLSWILTNSQYWLQIPQVALSSSVAFFNLSAS